MSDFPTELSEQQILNRAFDEATDTLRTSSSASGSSSSAVQGAAAHDAVYAGNPVLTGGYASATAPSDVSADGDAVRAWFRRNGAAAIYNAYLHAGEDTTNDLTKVEQRYTYSRHTADGLVKTGSGFVHTVTFSATGAVTAGVITLYDNTSETGTAIWSGTIQTGLNPFSIILDVSFTTGLYAGFDGTIANVAATVSYR